MGHFCLGVEKGRESSIRIMSEAGVKETEGLSMIKVTSEQARKWGEELRGVADARERAMWRNPFATMESETDSGARELLHGFEIGSRDEDRDLRVKAQEIVFKPTGSGENKKLLMTDSEWEGGIDVPVLGVYGIGVKLGEIYRAEKSHSSGGLGAIVFLERGLVGEYRRQLVEAKNPELLKVLDAVLTGIKEKGKKNG